MLVKADHDFGIALMDLMSRRFPPLTEGAKWGEHCSFVAPENHPLPSVGKKHWPIRSLDHFILGRLESEKLQPSPAADPAQWLRRASFDLIGLPPSIDELDAFQQAASANLQNAIEKETDRLLASPHFGERWASVWMDLARYADSAGYADDDRREVWKYRDWLIDAFNRDLPFDQFTIEQIAGDLIPNATLDQKLATPFSRLTQINSEGGTDDEEFHEASIALSKRMAAAAPDDLAARIAYGYRLAASREITPDRSSELRELYQHLVAEYAAAPDTMKDLADTPEKAALAIVASVLLNLDEALVR